MNCEKTHKIIPDYLAGALEPAEAEAVREHLAACEACRREVKAHERAWALVGNLPELTPKPGFTAAVRERLRKDAPRSRPLHSTPLRVALAVAASLLLVVGLYFIVAGGGGHPVIPNNPTVNNGLNLTAAQRAEIIENLDLFENYNSLSDEKLKSEDIQVLAKEEFVAVEELADRGVNPNFGETSSTDDAGTNDE